MMVIVIMVITAVVVMAIEETAVIEAIGNITVMEEREREMMGVSSVQPSLLAGNLRLQIQVRVMMRYVFVLERGEDLSLSLSPSLPLSVSIPLHLSLYLFSSALLYLSVDVIKSLITLSLFYSTLQVLQLGWGRKRGPASHLH
jgi:hypothetical protein